MLITAYASALIRHTTYTRPQSLTYYAGEGGNVVSQLYTETATAIAAATLATPAVTTG